MGGHFPRRPRSAQRSTSTSMFRSRAARGRNGLCVQREPVLQWRGGKTGGGESAETLFPTTSGSGTASCRRERLGMSVFVLEGSVVYHTCFTHGRGVVAFCGTNQWLEEGARWCRHDAYQKRHSNRYCEEQGGAR